MNEKKIILIDWDDTMFPTSWAIYNEVNLNNKNNIDNLYNYLEDFDNNLLSFLQKISTISKVIIVTNAMVGWVHISGRYLKKSYKYILDNINIISARDLYQKHYPNNIYKWKQIVFEKEINKYINNDKLTHSLISIGDADYEYKALINMHYTENIRNKIKYFKNIKFRPKADIKIINDQITVLNKYIDNILNSERHLDLEFNNLI